jgi:hypothetical protein
MARVDERQCVTSEAMSAERFARCLVMYSVVEAQLRSGGMIIIVSVVLGSSAALISLRNVQESEQDLPGILSFSQGSTVATMRSFRWRASPEAWILAGDCSLVR